MIEQDTIKLLRECDAGVKTGLTSLSEIMDSAKDGDLKRYLSDCKSQHELLQDEINGLLNQYQDEGKDPNPMAKSMSWLKTNMKLTADKSDHTVADLVTDGCNMGVKSLNKYMNQYKAADEQSKDIAKRLVNMEEELTHEVRQFL